MLFAAIETGTTNKWYGRIINLPGTIAKAKTRDNLFHQLSIERNEYVVWLKRFNEDLSIPTGGEIVIKEEVLDIAELGESGGSVALFEFDIQPISSEKLENYLRLMNYSRQSLLELINKIPESKMSKKLLTSERTPIQILKHVCNAEEWYISRLGEEAEQLYERFIGMPVPHLDSKPIFERLRIVRKGCVDVLKELIIPKEARIFTTAAYTNHPDEKWTAHKVLRRFIEHEREHYYSIQNAYI